MNHIASRPHHRIARFRLHKGISLIMALAVGLWCSAPAFAQFNLPDTDANRARGVGSNCYQTSEGTYCPPGGSSAEKDTEIREIRPAEKTSFLQSFVLWPLHLFAYMFALPFCTITLNTNCIQKILKDSVEYSPPARLAAELGARRSSEAVASRQSSGSVDSAGSDRVDTSNTTDVGASRPSPGDDGTVAGRSGTPTFGVESNPSGLQFEPANPEPSITSKSIREQLAGISQSGETAQAAPSDERAKRQGACGFATTPCEAGDAAPPVILKDVPRGSQRLSPELRSAMLATVRGKLLIEAEQKALAAEAEAKDALDDIAKQTAGATNADQQILAAQRAAAYQNWSDKHAESMKAMGDVEEAARSWTIDFSEKPVSSGDGPAPQTAQPRQ